MFMLSLLGGRQGVHKLDGVCLPELLAGNATLLHKGKVAIPLQHKCCWRVTQACHKAGMGPQYGFVTWICQDNRAQLMPSKNKVILSPAWTEGCKT